MSILATVIFTREPLKTKTVEGVGQPHGDLSLK